MHFKSGILPHEAWELQPLDKTLVDCCYIIPFFDGWTTYVLLCWMICSQQTKLKLNCTSFKNSPPLYRTFYTFLLSLVASYTNLNWFPLQWSFALCWNDMPMRKGNKLVKVLILKIMVFDNILRFSFPILFRLDKDWLT